MKTGTLFQLAGISVLVSALLTGIGSMIYLLSGSEFQATALFVWRGIFAGVLFLLGFGSLYARQSQAGGIPGLVGYILIMLAQMYFVGSDVVALGVAAGVVSNEQIAQVSSYVLSDTILPWIWVAGLIAFGFATYRANVFPKYAGAILILLGLIQPLAGSFIVFRWIYAASYFTVWAWLGWALYSKAGLQQDAQPALQQGAATNAGR